MLARRQGGHDGPDLALPADNLVRHLRIMKQVVAVTFCHYQLSD
jgi:hypothetical protein